MGDKELLELAAKAAGIKVNKTRQGEREASGVTGGGLWTTTITNWDPENNDGDSMRLAVKLHLAIDHNHPADQQRWVVAERQGCEGCYSPVTCIEDEFDESDRPAATRLAILRAAGEIGKEMP